MRLVRRVEAAWRFFRRPRVFDTTLVIVLAGAPLVGMIAMLAQGYPQPAAASAQFAQFAISVLPLLVRRRHPVAAAAAVTALDVFGLLTGIISATNVPITIALYSVGRYLAGRTAVIVAVAASVVYNVAFHLSIETTGGPIAWVPNLVSFLVFTGLGQLVRVRAELRERGRREAAEEAVRAERRRIARELHDVVAHHLSVINALVGGARATLPPGHEVTREALTGAEGTARQALTEMRQLLDVLRADGGEGDGAATGVGTSRLPALLEEARTAGLPATLTVAGEAVALPTAVDHAVYRIVQEALTNTRKHAPGARAGVVLTYRPEAVEVEVVDDGVPEQAVRQPAAPPGFGLGGMAERVALCGGELQTGPRAEGGFRVRARIPLEKT
ncbi:sensor histidine kinase [Nonomuraea muscovyensis]|uniref:histidine kinase n=1 Tax=Nonomuraea muscovyensis TaxID=1124761 RepID=A0A7X0EYN2_9ACTN|nr:sensor histidine kinase [Nonomuraea muscovyensis]MBB6346624.1 signal transduction histidine kinase [Nonomuraea muscovyensis]